MSASVVNMRAEQWLAMQHASLSAASTGKVLSEDLLVRQDELTQYIHVAEEMGSLVIMSLARIGAVDLSAIDWRAFEQAVISISQAKAHDAQMSVASTIEGEE